MESYFMFHVLPPPPRVQLLSEVKVLMIVLIGCVFSFCGREFLLLVGYCVEIDYMYIYT